jgi:Replication initiator protein A.
MSLPKTKSIITTTKTTIEKMKPKTINIKADEDFIENNLIDLPFIYYYKSKEPVTSVKYEWISSDGKKKSIEVRSSKLGVPTSYDYDVLLALLRLYVRQEGDRIVCKENIESLTELDNTVHFSYRELIAEMGYKDYTVKLKNKIDDSIERLCDTNIYNIGGGIYNPLTKEYIQDYKYQINILYDYKSYKYIVVGQDEKGDNITVLDKNSLKDKVSVKISLFFLKNLLCGKGKISDKNLRLSLKLDVSRRLYLILNKWRNGRGKFFLKFETLYDRIPLTDDKSDYYRKRRLKDACEELKNTNFIVDYIFNKQGVEFIFNEYIELAIAEEENINGLLKKYNTYDEIINALKDYGITDQTINEHLKLHEIPNIQALLRYIEDRKSTIGNVVNYIFKGLVQPYENIDKKYYNQ